ncbi:MAG: hypothetical protein EOO24_19065, partial [Comamonadaceae bacterium]
MTDDTYVDATNGSLTLSAEGAVTIGKLRSTKVGGTVSITSGGVVDGGEGETDIIAATSTLKIVAKGGIGSTNAIEVQVAVLDVVNSGSGAVRIQEVDTLTVKQLDQQGSGDVELTTVRGTITVAASGSGIKATTGDVVLYAAGQGAALYLGKDVKTTSGNVSATAEDGDITLAAGIRVSGTGNITLTVPKGGIVNDDAASGWRTAGAGFDAEIDWAMRLGYFAMDEATGAIVAAGIPGYLQSSHLANGTVLRQAGGPFLQTIGGNITMLVRDAVGRETAGFMYSPRAIVVDALTLRVSSSNRDDVAIIATGAIAVQNASGVETDGGTRGGATQVGALSGMQTISNAVDASGSDISVRATDLEIKQTIRSAGAVLNLATLDPSATILLGDLAGSGSQSNSSWMVLTNSELAFLHDGFREIVIGSASTSGTVMIGEQGTTAGVTLKDTLHIMTPGLGGHVYVNTDLVLTGNSSLIVDGSGHTTSINANETVGANIEHNDSVLIGGDRTLTAGTTGSGAIRLGSSNGHSLNGNGDASPDILRLNAPGNIIVTGSVGNTDALEGMVIGGVTVGGSENLPDNVTFQGEVTMDGDLVIKASGVVTFREQVVLRAGASLDIRGATQVVFEKGLRLEGTDSTGTYGDILIEADEISLPASGESIVGRGLLTLRPTTVGLAIEIGTPTDSQITNTLNIDNSELLALGGTFQRVIVGHVDGTHANAQAGAVRIGAVNFAGQSTVRSALEVYGGSITVEDYSTSAYSLRIGGDLKLDAVNDIVLRNRVEARSDTGLADIVLYSQSGAVTQADAADGDGVSGEALRGRHLDVRAATGITLQATELT